MKKKNKRKLKIYENKIFEKKIKISEKKKLEKKVVVNMIIIVYSLIDIDATAFRKSYEQPILNLQQPQCDQDALEIGNDCASELSHLTSQFVLRRTQDVMKDHLPPKVETTVFCRPSAMQVIYYTNSSFFFTVIQWFIHCDHFSFFFNFYR